MAHTPGPWERSSSYETGNCGDLVVAITKGRFIAEVAVNDEEQDDNARLIAAAPDLLAACTLAAKFVAKYTADTESVIARRALRRIEAAIEKAEETDE